MYPSAAAQKTVAAKMRESKPMTLRLGYARYSSE